VKKGVEERKPPEHPKIKNWWDSGVESHKERNDRTKQCRKEESESRDRRKR